MRVWYGLRAVLNVRGGWKRSHGLGGHRHGRRARVVGRTEPETGRELPRTCACQCVLSMGIVAGKGRGYLVIGIPLVGRLEVDGTSCHSNQKLQLRGMLLMVDDCRRHVPLLDLAGWLKLDGTVGQPQPYIVLTWLLGDQIPLRRYLCGDTV